MGGNFRHRLVRYYWKKTPTIVKNAKSHHENSSGTSSRTPIPLGWWFRVQHPGSLRSASFTHEIGKYHAYRVYHPTWLWLNMNGDVLIFLVIYLDKEHFLNRVYDKQMADGFYFFFFFASFDSQRVYHIFVTCFSSYEIDYVICL